MSEQMSKLDELRAEAAKTLRETYVGLKLQLTQLPYSRTFTTQEKITALDRFGEDIPFRSVRMSKILFDSQEPAVKTVREIIQQIRDVYEDGRYTLPYPERGIRLVKNACYEERDYEVRSGERKPGDPGKYVERLDKTLSELSRRLRRAAEVLVEEMPAIRRRAKEAWKGLYNPADYAFDAAHALGVSWAFVDLDVPSYLRRLDPDMVARAEALVMQQFEAACRLKEEELAEELFGVLDRLVDRLTGSREDGKPKIFRTGTAERLFKVIEDADRQLNETGIGRGPLQEAFAKLKQIVTAKTPSALTEVLRNDDSFRTVARVGFEEVANQLLTHAVEAPKRRLLRSRALSKLRHGD